jgi:tetratricopeptide (TPR) repeat protein
MSLETLNDPGRALMCYESAVNSASPLEARHVPLLVKLLHRQEATGEMRGAARTSERLAQFGSDAQEVAAHYTAAAEAYLTVQDRESALAAAVKAVEADPYDLDAVNVASELHMAGKNFDEAAAVLGRALSGSDEGDSEYVAARKANLWNRLAHARRNRGDVKGATNAFDKSVALAPDSPGAMDSRRQLLRLWKDDPDKRETLLEYRRIIAADSMELADVVNYARALCRGKDNDGGRALLELAEVMGHRMGPLDIAFLERRPVYGMAADEAYRNPLSEEHHRELVLGRTGDERDADDSVTVKVLRALWEAASVIWADPEESLERCGLATAKRVPASSNLAAAAIFPNIVSALGLSATVLYTTDMPDAPDVQVVCVSTPIVVVGPRLQVPVGWDAQGREAGQPSDAELRFLLARAAHMTRPEYITAVGMPYADFSNRLASILRCFGPEKLHGAVHSEIDDPDIQRAHDEMLRGDLPVKLRDELEAILADANPRDFDLNRYYNQLDRAADRAGLLLCGDIATAVECAGEVTQDGARVTRYVLQVPLMPSYLAARRKLGVGVR